MFVIIGNALQKRESQMKTGKSTLNCFGGGIKSWILDKNQMQQSLVRFRLFNLKHTELMC